MSLTGRFWFRKTWTGKLVLLVEERHPRWFGGPDAFKLRWRNATLMDFAEPQLRPLLNLEHSFRPQTVMARPPGLRVVATAKAEEPAPAIAKAA